MPIDPSIIFNAGRLKTTPFENLDTMLRAQQVRQRADDERRKRQAAQQMQEIWTTYGDDVPEALKRSYSVDPETAAKIEQQYSSARSNWALEAGRDIENEKKQTDRSVQLLSAAKGDPELFQTIVPILAQRDPDFAAIAQTLQGPDDPRIDALLESRDTVNNILDRRQKGIEAFMKGDTLRGVADTLLTATGPEEFQEMLQGFAPHIGKVAAANFAKMTPEQLQAAAQTETQREAGRDRRADNERQAQSQQMQMARDAAMAEERAIDNKRADAQLGVSRAQLGLSQARLEQAQKAAAQGPTLSPTAESNIINRLSNQWTAATKTTRELDRAINLMDTGLAAARRGDLAAGSQAVLVTFQKILDPTSVVRETEYDRSAAGQSVMNRVAGAFERLSQGGAGIRLGELEKFATLAKEAAQSQKGAIEPIRERIGKTADRYKIPRELVVEGAATPAATTTAPASAPAGGGMPTYADYLKRKRGGQ